ncbi:uncharacterized protein RCC_05140 [Ramularia collo-cygni]|uniref:Uncharacterized protein n=1 Tax=Ramularia collo-cygni TaxID=112498 RepID=A0A2D3V9J3_9PEZI|nr:uncharacterized protein RCC_05140 [Ramularia collo-cygni]CZT19294.1 uncharacterized protein RCC_05140 [Ramularia collo-cygni]
MADATDSAREAQRAAEKEYNRLGKANVRMRTSRTTLEMDIEMQSDLSWDEMAVADVKLEEQIERAKTRHLARLHKIGDKYVVLRERMRERQEEIDGRIEQNENRRQALRLEWNRRQQQELGEAEAENERNADMEHEEDGGVSVE